MATPQSPFPSAFLRSCVLAAAAVAAAAAPAGAHIVYGLTTGGQIFTVDSNAPGVSVAIGNVRGLQPGEIALAIDIRPATGQLFLLGSTSRLYVTDSSGQLRFGCGPFAPAVSGTVVGFDFDPAADRLRIVGATGQNLRVDPDSCAATADGVLNPGAPHITGSAYASNHAGTSAAALYAIDSTTDALFLQNPQTGALTLVGPLGVDTSDDVGFDISANDGIAFATLTIAGVSRLCTIDLTTGAATVLAPAFGGSWRDMTVLSRGVPMLALRNGTELARFHSASPSVIRGTVAITGLPGGESLAGIDVRPADGSVYGIGLSGRLYVINAVTGTATAIGPTFAPALDGTRFGLDFDPVTDRLRVVSNTGQNLQIDPDTGAVQADAAISPAAAVAGVAYTNNTDGAQFATLFDIDPQTDQVLTQALPDDGVLTPVGPLGVDAGGDVGFDVSPLDGVAFAALSVGGVSGLYTINLTTGAARLIGPIGTGAAVNGLAALPTSYVFAEGATGTFFDTDLLLANPTATPVPVTVTYLTELADVVGHSLTLPPQSRTTVSADADAALGATAFSSVVTSHLGTPIAVERTMRWDASGYGMHTEKGAPALSRTWYFAEGSQGFYNTYFLLTNTTPLPMAAQLRFLLENGTVVVLDALLIGESRQTVFAGDIPELVNQAFGTVITFSNAGAAERAMYFGNQPLFNGGHESAGVSRPATEWFLAEGATGSFFTTFVLLANPNATPASVTMTYLREGGGTVTRAKTVPANARLTINLAGEDPSLAATSVATRVTADVPIVVERAQYWPFDPAQWQEAHGAFGVTETGRHWALAEGRVGGPFAFQTFVLLANPGATPATVTLTILRTTGAPVVKTVTVQAGARRTVTTGPGSFFPELADESFGVSIASDEPIFAERAMYSNANGIFWAAGSNATATAIP
jgi:hypothetical protein